LIGRGPILERNSFPRRAYTVLVLVSKDYSVLQGTFPRVTHPCATHPEGCVRLACVRPAASVRPEPGSNSQVNLESRAFSQSLILGHKNFKGIERVDILFVLLKMSG
ncbi:unnamed protein product, partial [Pararhodospirillum photometricum DSM 122]